MSAGLADKQAESIRWAELSSGAGFAHADRDNLRTLLTSTAGDSVEEACRDLEGSASNQGHVFECAPAVVSVIAAALADDSVPPENRGCALDLLGLILAGYSAPSEVALGRSDLRERCYEEAMKGYWVLARLACRRDRYNNWALARDLLGMLDPEHSAALLSWSAAQRDTGSLESMSSGLAARQLESIKWTELRSGYGSADRVRVSLEVLLFVDGQAAHNAYESLENAAESQGHLFQCAPAVVSVVVAALADGTVPSPNVGSAIDVMGRILAGYPDDSEVAQGEGDLRERCYEEAMTGYWVLARLACERDPYHAWEPSREVLSMLDPDHAALLLA